MVLSTGAGKIDHRPFHLPLPPEQRWYVVQTIANREKIARINLEAQGYTAFLPQV